MGVVYRAHDPRLDRTVAIKALPEELAQDAGRLERFEREARTLAQLNHPNLAGIHGLEEDGGHRYLVLEFVEGETLADRLDRGPLAVDEAVALAAQIAAGVEAAHDAGVVHRDLKPANIIVTAEARAKVLDFGLARKDNGMSSSGSGLSQSPTMTNPTPQHSPTIPGAILGTAAYMSPEQARGRHVDKRTDIWSFGVLLYEMLVGASPFVGETASDSIGAVLHKSFDLDQLPPETPANVRRVLTRCLQRDKDLRYRDIGDARLELLHGSLDRAADAAPEQGAGRSRGHLLGWLVAALLGVVSIVLAVRVSAPSELKPQVIRTTITLTDGQRQPRLMQSPLAITRDGSLLAYVARDTDGIIRLYLRPLDRFEYRVVPGSENARAPFFSPDGEWIGFLANGGLMKSRVDGGQPFRLASASSIAFGASWGSDGTIVYAPTINSGLWRVSEDGGDPWQLTQPDFEQGGYAHVWPHHLADNRHVVFTVWGGDSVDRILDLRTESTRALRLREQGYAGSSNILPSGHLVMADVTGGGKLLAAPIDLTSLELLGPTVPVLDDVRYFDSQSATPYIAVSETGTAVFVSRDMGEATVMWVDRDGNTEPIRTGPEIVAGIRVSPNGKRAVFGDEQGGTWLLDLVRGTIDIATRPDNLFAIYPIWHPDGDKIIVASNTDSSWNLYAVNLSDRSEPQKLLDRPNNQYPASMSQDGRLLAFVENNPETSLDVWVLSEQGEPRPIARTPAEENQPALSPDGRLIAYTSSESGRTQIYLQGLDSNERLDVSINGGEQPVWSRDGQGIFFRRGNRMLSVEVVSDPALSVSQPVEVFEMPIESGNGFGTTPHYDISPDGTKFLAVTERPTTEFKVITNWFEELTSRVPTNRR